ncbi:hypothetical protein [Chitinophaga barathri]|uniref:Uncharacterized protein n=1 Tax=Chitinophaga barathri TaxID=1647451 RepID=A0A3N4MSG3_9BACT|nr:hypothetical protein [Chitinophaga barathri]RPD43080.1 hypothetical protein EG028_01955 [Chitinophaga barathri]
MAQYHRVDHAGSPAVKASGQWIYAYPTVEQATLALLGAFIRSATAYGDNGNTLLGISRSIQDDDGNIICKLAPEKDNRFFLTAYPTAETALLIFFNEILQGRRPKDPAQAKRAKKWHVGSVVNGKVEIDPALRLTADRFIEAVAIPLIPQLPATVTTEYKKKVLEGDTEKTMMVNAVGMFADVQQARLACVHYLDRLDSAGPESYKDITSISIHQDNCLEGFWEPPRDMRRCLTYMGGPARNTSLHFAKLPSIDGCAVHFQIAPLATRATKKYPYPIGEYHRVLYYDSHDHALQCLLSLSNVMYQPDAVRRFASYRPKHRCWIESNRGELLAEIGFARHLELKAASSQYPGDQPGDAIYLIVSPQLYSGMQHKEAAGYFSQVDCQLVGTYNNGNFEINTEYLLRRIELLDYYLGSGQQHELAKATPYEVFQYYGYERAPEIAPFFQCFPMPTIREAAAFMLDPAKAGISQPFIPQPYAGKTDGPTLQQAVVMETGRRLPLIVAGYNPDLSVANISHAKDLLPHPLADYLNSIGVQAIDLRQPVQPAKTQLPATNYHLTRMQERLVRDQSDSINRKQRFG